MQIRFLVDEGRLRRWQCELVARVAARAGVIVSVGATTRQSDLPAGADSLFQIETLLHRLPVGGPASKAPMSELARWRTDELGAADIMIDLGASAPADSATWRLTFDGVSGETALLDAVLDRRAPLVEIWSGGAVIASGRPGTEYGGVTRRAFEDVLSRVSTLVVAALDGAARQSPPLMPDGDAARLERAASLPAIALKQIARKIVHRIYSLCCHTPHWRVGWRKIDGVDLFDLRAHPASGWTDLPDDGRRFYADPFPLLRDGRTTLFVEDYPHATGKGVISAVEFDASGPVGAPRPVLETSCHLSYPFVFEADGETWMIPETCGAGVIELYRAARFPDAWVKEATLVSGVVASDTTLCRRDGRWWLFATVRDGGGAFSDTLCLWSASDFRGPWTAHPRNPVLVDIASARPAGRMIERGGVLYRPVQDCRRGYGAALAIARVSQLDDEGFRQEVETLLGPGPEWRGNRIHTVNSAGCFEFIDGSGFAPRWAIRGKPWLLSTRRSPQVRPLPSMSS